MKREADRRPLNGASFAALLTGLLLALGTPWGLFRHYWIVTKFLLTIGAIIVLLVHTNAMREAATRVSGAAGETLPGVRAHLVERPSLIIK